jgi:hypothetical protein
MIESSASPARPSHCGHPQQISPRSLKNSPGRATAIDETVRIVHSVRYGLSRRSSEMTSERHHIGRFYALGVGRSIATIPRNERKVETGKFLCPRCRTEHCDPVLFEEAQQGQLFLCPRCRAEHCDDNSSLWHYPYGWLFLCPWSRVVACDRCRFPGPLACGFAGCCANLSCSVARNSRKTVMAGMRGGGPRFRVRQPAAETALPVILYQVMRGRRSGWIAWLRRSRGWFARRYRSNRRSGRGYRRSS